MSLVNVATPCAICGNGGHKRHLTQLTFKWLSKATWGTTVGAAGASVTNGGVVANGGSVTVSSSGGRLGAWLELSTSGGYADLHVSCSIPLMLQQVVSFPDGELVLVGFVDTTGINEATATCGILGHGKTKKSTSQGKTNNPKSKHKTRMAKRAGTYSDADSADTVYALNVSYSFGSRWGNCLTIDDSVVLGADLADCGLHGSIYHCDHWNLTNACEGPAAVPGTEEMNTMCSVLCRNVPGCRGFMVDTVTDPSSGLCILGSQGSFGLVDSCFFFASSDLVLSEEDCHPSSGGTHSPKGVGGAQPYKAVLTKKSKQPSGMSMSSKRQVAGSKSSSKSGSKGTKSSSNGKSGSKGTNPETCTRPTSGARIDRTAEHTQLGGSAVAAGIIGTVGMLIMIVAIIGTKRALAARATRERTSAGGEADRLEYDDFFSSENCSPENAENTLAESALIW